MTPQEIYALSGEELRTQAKVLEISLKGNPGDALIHERMIEALGLSEEPSNKPQVTAINLSKKTVTIMIATKEDDDQPVAVGLNGKVYRMVRGEEVEVPTGVVDILNNAKQMIRDRKTGKDREVLAYPFQIVAG
jgi:hypothetical protein